MSLDNQLPLFADTDKVELKSLVQVPSSQPEEVTAIAAASINQCRTGNVVHLTHVRSASHVPSVSAGDLLSRVLNRTRFF